MLLCQLSSTLKRIIIRFLPDQMFVSYNFKTVSDNILVTFNHNFIMYAQNKHVFIAFNETIEVSSFHGETCFQ